MHIVLKQCLVVLLITRKLARSMNGKMFILKRGHDFLTQKLKNFIIKMNRLCKFRKFYYSFIFE
jgi:hypothetical protein